MARRPVEDESVGTTGSCIATAAIFRRGFHCGASSLEPSALAVPLARGTVLRSTTLRPLLSNSWVLWSG